VDEPDRQSAAAMWAEYVAEHPEYADDTPPPLERFGDSAQMADELLDTVLHGPKRATAGAVAEFRADEEPLPRIGGHWIVADAAGQACAVIRSLELRIGPLDSVDEAFAWDEGEGERTREWWLDAHRAYMRRAFAGRGLEYDDRIEVVFERFAVVWPPAYAD